MRRSICGRKVRSGAIAVPPGIDGFAQSPGMNITVSDSGFLCGREVDERLSGRSRKTGARAGRLIQVQEIKRAILALTQIATPPRAKPRFDRAKELICLGAERFIDKADVFR
jgi:hypothetical protein